MEGEAFCVEAHIGAIGSSPHTVACCCCFGPYHPMPICQYIGQIVSWASENLCEEEMKILLMLDGVRLAVPESVMSLSLCSGMPVGALIGRADTQVGRRKACPVV